MRKSLLGNGREEKGNISLTLRHWPGRAWHAWPLVFIPRWFELLPLLLGRLPPARAREASDPGGALMGEKSNVCSEKFSFRSKKGAYV